MEKLPCCASMPHMVWCLRNRSKRTNKARKAGNWLPSCYWNAYNNCSSTSQRMFVEFLLLKNHQKTILWELKSYTCLYLWFPRYSRPTKSLSPRLPSIHNGQLAPICFGFAACDLGDGDSVLAKRPLNTQLMWPWWHPVEYKLRNSLKISTKSPFRIQNPSFKVPKVLRKHYAPLIWP